MTLQSDRARRPGVAARRAATALAAAIAAIAAVAPGSVAAAGDEIVVKLQRGDAIGALLLRHRLTLVDRLGPRPIFRLRTIGGAPAADAIDALRADVRVLLAEPNTPQGTPEGQKNHVWAIGTASAYADGWAWPRLRLADAQAISRGAGVRVAVVDGGVDRSHPALAGRLDPGRDFVDGDADPSEAGAPGGAGFGHGTHVAGLVARVAPQARIVPLRVLDAQGRGTLWALGAALLHAVDPDGDASTDDGAQVINLSLGTPERTRLVGAISPLVTCVAPDPAEPADPAQDASDAGYAGDRARCALRRGALIVAAAGNDGSTARYYPAAEGAYGLLPVAATTPDDRLAAFSNRGGWIGLGAPGQALTSSVPGGWGTWSGTSMAAPLVSGAAALLRSARPSLPVEDVARCLLRRTAPLDGTPIRRLDPPAALRGALSDHACR